jgi:predicted nuclease of predicted toxin-antitoxin system
MPPHTRGWDALVNLKLLLDENISPKVAEALRQDGIDACSVRDRGLLQATDHEVLERAYTEDRILVTKNVGDFEKLASAREFHAGIVLLEDGDLDRVAQLSTLRKVVELLKEERDVINRILRVAADGSMRLEDIQLSVR